MQLIDSNDVAKDDDGHLSSGACYPIVSLVVFGNFVSFGFLLGWWTAKKWPWGIDGQGETIVFVVCATLGGFLGRVFLDTMADVPDPRMRDVLIISTFSYPAAALTPILSPWHTPTIFLLLPLFLLAACRAAPEFLKSSWFSPLELTVMAFTQTLALTFLLRGANDFNAAYLTNCALWVAVLVLIRWLPAPSRLNVDFAFALLQPLTVLWFFTNLSNQTFTFLPRFSVFCRYAGMVLAGLYLLMGLYLSRVDAPRYSIYRRLLGIISVALFAAGLLCDSQISRVIQMHPPGDLDGHFWKTVEGINEVFGIYKPYSDLLPAQGVIWHVYFSRLWFVYLKQSLLSYFLAHFGLGLLGQILYAGLLVLLLRRLGGFGRFEAWLPSSLLVIANLPPLLVYYPYQYAWMLVERLPLILLCSVGIFAYTDHDGSRLCGIPKKLFAFILGFLHGMAYHYDLSTGTAALLGLFAIIAFLPHRIPHKFLLLLGAFSAAALYIMFSFVTWIDFFIHSPLHFGLWREGGGMIPSGTFLSYLFNRDAILQSAHFLLPLSILMVFLAKTSLGNFRADRAFPFALYLFAAILSLFVTRGFTMIPNKIGGFDTSVFVSSYVPICFASALSVPFAIATLFSAGYGANSKLKLPNLPLVQLTMCAVIFLSFADGLYLSLIPSQAPRDGYQKLVGEPRNDDVQNLSWSIPSVAQYFYEKRNLEYIKTKEQPTDENLKKFYLRYPAWVPEAQGKINMLLDVNEDLTRFNYNDVYNPFDLGRPWEAPDQPISNWRFKAMIKSENLVNLSLHHPATMSGSLPDDLATPERGNDGKTNHPSWGFITNIMTNPWWQVDLLSVKHIRGIRIYNSRTEAWGIRSLRVLISKDGVNWTTVFADEGNITHGHGALLIPLNAEARYVRTQLNRKDYLHLNEVEVWGSP